MITEKDLYKGLQFKGGESVYTIYNNECTQIKGDNIYNGYSKKEICQYINQGSWILMKPINKIYELW